MNDSTPRVLFVCTGNLCRSPIAEGLLRKQLVDRNLADAIVDSAGMHAQDQLPPAPLAIEVALDYGADISALRSRPFRPEDFDNFDQLIAMDLGHLDYLRATAPIGVTANSRLLLEDVGQFKNLEVPDPYQQDRDAFEFAARLIDVGVKDLIQRLYS